MITLKSDNDIKNLRAAGKILAAALLEVEKFIKPGITTMELNNIVEKFILDNGAEPSFKNYQNTKSDPPFPSALCTSINNEVVHAPASGRVLKNGDIVGIDAGLKYFIGNKYYFVDVAKTVPVGKVSGVARKLIDVTRECLNRAIREVRPNNTLKDIGRAVQEYAKSNGFSVVRGLVGHGVGFAVHEEPQIPNFVSAEHPRVVLKPGMVLALEPMVNAGGYGIDILDDGWTVVTSDGSLSAHFEHTVAVTENGHEILTLP